MQKQRRTKKLDKHWGGYYWCDTCKLYTGYVTRDHRKEHKNHNLIKLEK